MHSRTGDFYTDPITKREYPLDDAIAPTSPAQADGGGLRFNGGKRDFTLIPPDALAYLADLFTIGAKKYAPRNWERGMKYSNIMTSLERHWFAFKSGEDHDPESKLYHMVHVVWNAMALLTYQLRGIGEDDRYKVPLPPTPDYDAMNAGASGTLAPMMFNDDGSLKGV